MPTVAEKRTLVNKGNVNDEGVKIAVRKESSAMTVVGVQWIIKTVGNGEILWEASLEV